MLLLLLACTAPSDSGADDSGADSGAVDRCGDTPTGQVALPADDAVHDEPVEWWYWTGHLRGDDGARYGFEQVFFLFQMGGSTRHIMGNVALTDAAADTFAYDVQYDTGYTPEQLDGAFRFVQGGWSAAGGGGHDALVGAAGDYAWELTLDAAKAPVLQHGDGYTDYDFGGYTYYYSRERMDVAGTLHTPAGPTAVTGDAWFDHQYGNLFQAVNVGWDWFALQLDDGRDIMLFLVRAGAAPSLVGGTVSDAQCNVAEVQPDGFSVASTGTWTSATSGCTWPQGWQVTVGDLALTLTPTRADQELYSPEDTYWEGEVVVTGDATGRGYVELTGYCE